MTKNLMELVFILDKSGSMGGLESDTIGGYNALLTKQKKIEGNVTVTTVLFNHHYELLHDRIQIQGVAPITEQDYEVSGTTALLDAIGTTIQKISHAQQATLPEQRADKVLFIITTDGMENASCEFDYHKIKKMVQHQKDKHSWEFIFLGANIDAISAAKDIGISEEFAVEYQADEEGTRLNYEEISEAVVHYRQQAKINPQWKKNIEENLIKRNPHK